MSAPCGCTPGTPENGWHETRSEACQEAERDQWRRLFANLPHVIHEIRYARGKA